MLRRSRSSALRTVLLVSVVAMCLFALVGTAFAVNADAYEPDNDSGAATSMNVGDISADHTIHEMGDEDWFVFSVSAGERYALETLDGDGMDTVMWLYDDSFNEITYDDDGAGSLYSKITFTADYTGDYYAVVAGFGGDNTGAYGLGLSLDMSGGISGTVTNGAADPVDTVDVYAYEYADGDSWQVGSASTQSDGSYEILGLDAGTYRIEFVDYNGQYAGEFYDDASTMDLATDIVVEQGVTSSGIDAVLEPAGHISGRISNSANAPLADISVQTYSYSPEWGYDWVWDTTSDPDGLYDVGGLRTGNYRVGFSDDSGNYLGEYYDNATSLETATDVAVMAGSTTSGKNAVLARAGHITGRVTNAAGQGLGDIEVAYYVNYDGYWDGGRGTWTDELGYYDIGGLPTGTYRIGFEDYSGDYLREYYNDVITLDAGTNIAVTAGSTTSGKNAVLGAAGHVAGTVTGPQGELLGDISVQVFKYDVSEGYWDWAGEQGTELDGTYNVGGLRTGTYRVGFEDYNGTFAPEYHNNAGTVETATDVAVTAGSTRTINATLALAGHITGRVTSAVGAPIEGILVTAYESSPWGWEWVTDTYTGSTGDYNLVGFGTRTYRIGFWDDSGTYLEEYYNDASSLDSATNIAATAGTTVSGKNAVLALAGHITGSVTNAVGDPIDTVDVFAYKYVGSAWEIVNNTWVESDGTYDMGGLRTGTYRIGFRDWSETYATEYYNNAAFVQSATDVAVTAGSTTSGKNAVLEVQATITAKATTAAGAPLEGINVMLWGQAGSTWVEASSGYTGSDGQQTLTGLKAGNYKLKFTDPARKYSKVWYLNAAEMTGATSISLTAGQARTCIQPMAAAPPTVVVAGDDRYSTAVLASKQSYEDGSADTVVIASGANWPDALGGGALAGALDGPVLLVNPSSLPGVVAAEIGRLGASHAIVVGGTAAVSDATKNAIDALAGVSTERIGGFDRYETAKKVAERAKLEMGGSYDGTVFLSTGANYPDALAASPLAAGSGWPILLTKSTGLPDFTKQALTNLAADRVLVIGGVSAVPDAVKVQAEVIVGSPALRLAGANRFDTAVKIATYGVDYAGLEWNGMALATGRKFPDALAGGCAQGKLGSVMLLTEVTALPAETEAAITAHKAYINQVMFFGGDTAISSAVRTKVANLLQ